MTEDRTTTDLWTLPSYPRYTTTFTSFYVYTTSVVTTSNARTTSTYTTSEELYLAFCPATVIVDTARFSWATSTNRRSLFASTTEYVLSGLPTIDTSASSIATTQTPNNSPVITGTGPVITSTQTGTPSSTSSDAGAATSATTTAGAERLRAAGMSLFVVMGLMGIFA
jgi:hypothetical protein